MQYASFGTPTTSVEFQITEAYMKVLGERWAEAGNSKLPRSVELPGRPVPFPILRSRHEWALSFIDGWKSAKG